MTQTTTVRCSVRRTAATLAVTGTARTVVIDIAKSRTIDLSDFESWVVLSICDSGPEGADYPVDLSTDEMEAVVRVEGRIAGTIIAPASTVMADPELSAPTTWDGSEDSNASPDECPVYGAPKAPAGDLPAPETAPAVRLCPRCGAVMQRMTSQKGWRCSRAGEFVFRRGRRRNFWTGCNGAVWDGGNGAVPAPSPAEAAVIATAPVPATVNGTSQVAMVQQRTAGEIASRTSARARATGTSVEERDLTRAADVLRKLVGRTYLLTYDIHETSGLPNPSGYLWPLGFRLEWSVWVLCEEYLESPVLKDIFAVWDHHNIRYHIIPQAPEALAQYRTMAAEALAKELNRAHTSLLDRLSEAADRLDKARAALADLDLTEKERDRRDAVAYNRRNTDIRRAIDDSAEALAYCVKSAERFDATEAVGDIVAALREALRSHGLAFNAEMLSKGRKGIDVPPAA